VPSAPRPGGVALKHLGVRRLAFVTTTFRDARHRADSDREPLVDTTYASAREVPQGRDPHQALKTVGERRARWAGDVRQLLGRPFSFGAFMRLTF